MACLKHGLVTTSVPFISSFVSVTASHSAASHLLQGQTLVRKESDPGAT